MFGKILLKGRYESPPIYNRYEWSSPPLLGFQQEAPYVPPPELESARISPTMGRQTENPVDRLKTSGPRSASIIDLLAVGFSRTEKDAAEGELMARSILKRFSNIAALSDLSTDDLREITGVEGFESVRSQALLEIGRRIGGASKGPVTEIEDADDVYSLLSYLRDEKKEHFVAVLLDSKNGVQRVAPIHIGTLTMSVVGPREVFREAIREGASSIIVAHNHPSGDPTPSPEDIAVTLRLAEIGDMLDIPVLDHVVLGYRNFVSLKERNLF